MATSPSVQRALTRKLTQSAVAHRASPFYQHNLPPPAATHSAEAATRQVRRKKTPITIEAAIQLLMGLGAPHHVNKRGRLTKEAEDLLKLRGLKVEYPKKSRKKASKPKKAAKRRAAPKRAKRAASKKPAAAKRTVTYSEAVKMAHEAKIGDGKTLSREARALLKEQGVHVAKKRKSAKRKTAGKKSKPAAKRAKRGAKKGKRKAKRSKRAAAPKRAKKSAKRKSTKKGAKRKSAKKSAKRSKRAKK